LGALNEKLAPKEHQALPGLQYWFTGSALAALLALLGTLATLETRSPGRISLALRKAAVGRHVHFLLRRLMPKPVHAW
jgi:hypothetical protein